MQTTYDLDYPVGVEGQKIEAYPSGILTGLAEAGIILVGKIVTMDTANGRNDKAAKHPTTAAMITGAGALGVAMWDPSYPEPPYAQYKAFPIMRKGRLLMVCETTIAKGVHPCGRFAVGTGTVLGALRADVDTVSSADTCVAVPWLTIVTPCTSVGGLCEVEVNL
jgi:hypothetical protein